MMGGITWRNGVPYYTEKLFDSARGNAVLMDATLAFR
jgi:hypothetical protein